MDQTCNLGSAADSPTTDANHKINERDRSGVLTRSATAEVAKINCGDPLHHNALGLTLLSKTEGAAGGRGE